MTHRVVLWDFVVDRMLDEVDSFESMNQAISAGVALIVRLGSKKIQMTNRSFNTPTECFSGVGLVDPDKRIGCVILGVSVDNLDQSMPSPVISLPVPTHEVDDIPMMPPIDE